MKSDENDKLIFALQVEHKKTNSDLQNINRSILDTSLAVASQSAMRNSISMNNSAIIALVAFFIGLFLGNWSTHACMHAHTSTHRPIDRLSLLSHVFMLSLYLNCTAAHSLLLQSIDRYFTQKDKEDLKNVSKVWFMAGYIYHWFSLLR